MNICQMGKYVNQRLMKITIKLNNENFNLTGFREIKNNEVGYSSFTLSPKR